MRITVERGAIVPEIVTGGLLQGIFATEQVCKSIVETIFRISSEWVGTSIGYNLRVARGERICLFGGEICNGS